MPGLSYYVVGPFAVAESRPSGRNGQRERERERKKSDLSKLHHFLGMTSHPGLVESIDHLDGFAAVTARLIQATRLGSQGDVLASGKKRGSTLDSIGVFFGWFDLKIEGPGLDGDDSIYQGHQFSKRPSMRWTCWTSFRICRFHMENPQMVPPSPISENAQVPRAFLLYAF